MRASVVIPTYNRLLDLQRTVAAVRAQEVPPDVEFEIVAVDDGSTDGTNEWLQSEEDRCSDLRVLHQRNSGPAGARNRGVEAASGSIVLFLGDDTVPQPGWLLTHLEEHRISEDSCGTAVLGYTSFPPETDSPFLRWINENGAQFGYRLIESPNSVPFNFFYTSNISLPRAWLMRLGGFREDFPAAAWEDIEFAYRATKDGMNLRYQPRARTLHYHRIRAGTFCRRQRTSGLSAAIFAGLHPELEGFLGVARVGQNRRRRPLCRALLSMLVGIGELVEGAVPPRVYLEYLDSCYLDGLAEGLHQS
ncbi:MAG: glycosyltransferase family 2 protein [Thermoanaerobaculales bacterium]